MTPEPYIIFHDRMQVSSVEEAWEAIDEGTVLRRAAETLKNERSSRSHSLVNIRVRGQSKLTGMPSFLCSKFSVPVFFRQSLKYLKVTHGILTILKGALF